MPILNFKGKSVIQNHHHTVKFHELEPVKAKGTSKTPSLDDNLIIHGDNLKALKALLPTYAGKVKCIYIDPPYNTGSEHWIYNDNVNSPMIKEWIGKEVARDDLTRHDKWCCMMYPRLCLLKEMLREDGVIFVSIDDNEVQHLRMIMDEIFSEDCYKNTITVRRGIKNVQSQFETIDRLALGHEYVLCYSKQPVRLSKLAHNLSESEKGKWDTFWRGTDRPTMRYKLFDTTPDKGQWRWEQGRAEQAKKNYEDFLSKFDEEKIDEYWSDHYTATNVKLDFVRKNDDGVVQYFVPPRSFKLISDNWMDVSIRGNETDDFETEKNIELIKRCIQWIDSNDKDAIILDSFAGSGTTAHAVLDLNKEDKGHRKFILIECEDYADSLTAERVRRVSKGGKDENDDNQKKGLGGSFSYYELGDPIDIDAMLDGKKLPSFENLAHYAFYTATGESFNPSNMKEKDFYVGSSSTFEVFMLYVPDADKLRDMALNLDFAQKIEAKFPKKSKLVFAPACFLEEFDLRDRNIRFAQLPFEIYRLAE